MKSIDFYKQLSEGAVKSDEEEVCIDYHAFKLLLLEDEFRSWRMACGRIEK